MNKLKLLFLLYILPFSIYTQSVSDILNITADNYIGTARFQAMGGAFGALGGDLSAININPAGSAVYNNNEFGITFSNNEKTTKSSYFSSIVNNENRRFSVNQAGGVWVLKNFGEGNLNKISFGINAQTNSSYYDKISVKGINNYSSIDNFFLNNSNGLTLSDLSLGNDSVSYVYRFLGENYGYPAQQAFLAFQGYVLEWDEINNTFFSLASYQNGVNQEHQKNSKGYNNKYNLNFSVNFKEDFFFGINLNIHEVYIENNLYHFETNFDENSAVKSILYEDRLLTIGDGFSLQLGAIKKFNNFRVGFSYQSPTWYTLFDETSQYLETNTVDIDGNYYTDIIDPRVVNLYPEYNIKSPSSITLSSALVLGNFGLISLDLESKDYSKTKVKPKGDFLNLNNEISTELQNTLNIRIGSEFKLNKLSLRAGYNSIESPYINLVDNSSSISFGFGYDLGSTIINFSHKSLEQDNRYQLFDSGLVDKASLELNNSISTISLIFKF